MEARWGIRAGGGDLVGVCGGFSAGASVVFVLMLVVSAGVSGVGGGGVVRGCWCLVFVLLWYRCCLQALSKDTELAIPLEKYFPHQKNQTREL